MQRRPGTRNESRVVVAELVASDLEAKGFICNSQRLEEVRGEGVNKGPTAISMPGAP